MSEKEEEKYLDFARENGMTINFTVAGVFIRSRKGSWIAEQGADGEWTLLHKNESYKGKVKNKGYHRHDKTWKTLKDVLLYIRAHDISRYTEKEKDKKLFSKPGEKPGKWKHRNKRERDRKRAVPGVS